SCMRRSSSAAFSASRSAMRRLISTAEKMPGPAGFVVLRVSDMFPSIGPLSASHQRAGMAGNHQILVGLDHIGGAAPSRHADALLVLPVGRFVALQTQPGTGAADCASHLCRILADTGSEHDSVEAAQRRAERGDVAGNSIAKHLDRKARTRVVAGQEFAK